MATSNLEKTIFPFMHPLPMCVLLQVCAIDRKYGADAHFAEGDVELSSHDHGHTYSIMNNLYTSKRTAL